jgi:hypothetical protein
MTAVINPALPASPPTSGISRYARQIGQGVRVQVTGQGFQEFSCRGSDGDAAGAPNDRRTMARTEPPHVVRS